MPLHYKAANESMLGIDRAPFYTLGRGNCTM